MFECYSKYSKVDVGKAIDLELKGDIEHLLVDVGKSFTLALSICTDLLVEQVSFKFGAFIECIQFLLCFKVHLRFYFPFSYLPLP